MTIRHQLTVLPLLLALTAMSLLGCATENKIETSPDDGFFTSQPCAAPCWHGLELNHSNRDDILDTLQRLSFVNPNSIEEWGRDFNCRSISFACHNSKSGFCGDLELVDNKLKSIILLAPQGLTLRVAIERQGAPDYISYLPYAADAPGCSLDMYWSDRSIILSSFDSQRACPIGDYLNQHLDPNRIVTSIIYVAKDMFGNSDSARIRWPGFTKQ